MMFLPEDEIVWRRSLLVKQLKTIADEPDRRACLAHLVYMLDDPRAEEFLSYIRTVMLSDLVGQTLKHVEKVAVETEMRQASDGGRPQGEG